VTCRARIGQSAAGLRQPAVGIGLRTVQVIDAGRARQMQYPSLTVWCSPLSPKPPAISPLPLPPPWWCVPAARKSPTMCCATAAGWPRTPVLRGPRWLSISCRVRVCLGVVTADFGLVCVGSGY
jgi:hypothetical protein